MRLSSLIWLIVVLLSSATLATCSSDDQGDGVGDSDTVGAAAAASTDAGGADPAQEAQGDAVATFDMGIEVTSPVFNRIRRIPKLYSCKGTPPKPGQAYEQDALNRYVDRENISPPLDWTGIPDGTKSIALPMDSDQVPGERWVHWLIWNLLPESTGVAERVATTTEVVALGPNVRQGMNDDGFVGYSGPCPLPVTIQSSCPGYSDCYKTMKAKVVMEYLFNVYALDTVLDLPGAATQDDFMKAIEGHVLSGGVIKGEFVASKQLN